MGRRGGNRERSQGRQNPHVAAAALETPIHAVHHDRQHSTPPGAPPRRSRCHPTICHRGGVRRGGSRAGVATIRASPDRNDAVLPPKQKVWERRKPRSAPRPSGHRPIATMQWGIPVLLHRPARQDNRALVPALPATSTCTRSSDNGCSPWFATIPRCNASPARTPDSCRSHNRAAFRKPAAVTAGASRSETTSSAMSAPPDSWGRASIDPGCNQRSGGAEPAKAPGAARRASRAINKQLQLLAQTPEVGRPPPRCPSCGS